ncbi:MAG: hypothetical protein E6F99_04445 [Actinobacteria bacterium]|nr:MAG: hypothetical protein E6F99_04445 [Actinomycetota bacterium]
MGMRTSALPFVITISFGGPVNAIRRRLTPAVLDLAGMAALAAAAVQRFIQLAWQRLVQVPDRPPARLGRPVAHVGATESFGTELRALRSIEVSPELVSDIENELRWGLIWHDFERFMQGEIDRVFAPYLAIAEAPDFDSLRELIGIRELLPA